jgi:hypothetical protein
MAIDRADRSVVRRTHVEGGMTRKPASSARDDSPASAGVFHASEASVDRQVREAREGTHCALHHS